MPDADYQVFVSYSHRDRAWIDSLKLSEPLIGERRGSFWVDEDRMRVGDVWTDRARGAIGRARAAVLLVSDAFLGSQPILEQELKAICEQWEDLERVVFVPIEGVSLERLGRQIGRILDKQPEELKLAERLAAVSWEKPLPRTPPGGDTYNHLLHREVLELLEPATAKLRRSLGTRYVIQGCLGSGPASFMLRARDPFLRRDVVVKALREREFLEIFDESIQEGARVGSHPNIVTTFEARQGRSHYSVREYIAGTSLERILDEGRVIKVASARNLIEKIGAALCHAHSRGICNLNVKPSNVLIQDAFGVNEAPFLCPSTGDGKLIELDAGREGVGRAELYLPPELQRGARSESAAHAIADQYRLGLLAYEMLCGRVSDDVAQARLKELRAKRVAATPWPRVSDARPDCPRAIAQAVDTMIQVDPARRYEDLGTALRAIGVLSIEAEMARDSYRRLLSQPDEKVRGFFEAFYRDLLGRSAEANRKFKGRGFPPLEDTPRRRASGKKRAAKPEGPKKSWKDQHALLREAILLLLAFQILGESEGAGDTVLTRIARTHGFGPRGLRITRDGYQAFSDALVQIAPAHDPVWEDADAETQQALRNAWRTTVASGIEYLKERAPKV